MRLQKSKRLKILCGSEEGSSLIELALSMSFFTLLLLGAAELGIVIYASVEVSNGARAACQYGAMNGGTGAPGSMDTSEGSYGEQTHRQRGRRQSSHDFPPHLFHRLPGGVLRLLKRCGNLHLHTW